MKKALFTIALLFLFVAGIQAQGDFEFGVKAGLNVSSLGIDTGLNYTPKPGFHAGVVVDVPFSDRLSVQPEVLVSLQGGSFVLENLNFLYLNLPIMGKYNIWDELHIEAGPQIGFLLSNNLDGSPLGVGENTIYDETNGFDMGLAVGAGYRLNDNFYFQLRYSAGIINAIKDSKSKNRVLQVSAIYFL